MQSHPINQSTSGKEAERTLIKLYIIDENDKENDEIVDLIMTRKGAKGTL